MYLSSFAGPRPCGGPFEAPRGHGWYLGWVTMALSPWEEIPGVEARKTSHARAVRGHFRQQSARPGRGGATRRTLAAAQAVLPKGRGRDRRGRLRGAARRACRQDTGAARL